jgi:hypothetical protein
MRWLVVNTILSYLSGVIILLSSLTSAADKPVSPVMVGPVKTKVVKPTKMHATGKVIEISDKSIKTEREVKGYIANMEVALDKPAGNISINDFIKIDYIEKDGKLVAARIVKVKLNKK